MEVRSCGERVALWPARIARDDVIPIAQNSPLTATATTLPAPSLSLVQPPTLPGPKHRISEDLAVTIESRLDVSPAQLVQPGHRESV